MHKVLHGLTRAVAMVGVVALVACTETTAPDDDGTPTPSTATIRVVNNTGEAIFYVYFSLCSDPSWGSDRLGSTETISDGASRSWTGVSPGCYDLRADTQSGRSVTFLSVQVSAGETETYDVQ
ncbi:MAG: hypothetical protein WD934_06270 [Gemmatimonadales bacterium]